MSTPVSTETADQRAVLVAVTKEAAQDVKPQEKPQSLISSLIKRNKHLRISDDPNIVYYGTPAAAKAGDLNDPRFHVSRYGLDTKTPHILEARNMLRYLIPKRRLRFWRDGLDVLISEHTKHRNDGTCSCAQQYKRIPVPGVPTEAKEKHWFTCIGSDRPPYSHRLLALVRHRRCSTLTYEWKIGLKGCEHFRGTKEYERQFQHAMEWLNLPTDGERPLSAAARSSVTRESNDESGKKRRWNP